MHEGFGLVYEFEGLMLHLLLQDIDLLTELLDEFELLHDIQRLSHHSPHFAEGRLKESLDQEGDVFDGEHLDGVVAVVVLASSAEDLEGIGAIAVHADVSVDWHL